MLPLRDYIEKSRLEKLKRKVHQELAKRNKLLQAALRNARKSAGLTQLSVAQCFGRDQTYIARLEIGSQTITFVEAEKLARIYGKRLIEFWADIPQVTRYRPSLSKIPPSTAQDI